MPAKAGIQRVMKEYFVYMLASKKNGTLYTGMTNDLIRRIFEHKQGMVKGFTQKYGIKTLVWYEQHNDVLEAIKREKNIQAWKRAWKLELIEKSNPDWDDLYEEIAGCQRSLA